MSNNRTTNYISGFFRRVQNFPTSVRNFFGRSRIFFNDVVDFVHNTQNFYSVYKNTVLISSGALVCAWGALILGLGLNFPISLLFPNIGTRFIYGTIASIPVVGALGGIATSEYLHYRSQTVNPEATGFRRFLNPALTSLGAITFCGISTLLGAGIISLVNTLFPSISTFVLVGTLISIPSSGIIGGISTAEYFDIPSEEYVLINDNPVIDNTNNIEEEYIFVNDNIPNQEHNKNNDNIAKDYIFVNDNIVNQEHNKNNDNIAEDYIFVNDNIVNQEHNKNNDNIAEDYTIIDDNIPNLEYPQNNNDMPTRIRSYLRFASINFPTNAQKTTPGCSMDK